MHELRIHRIDLVGGNRTIEFAGDFAVISGSITTGKTTVVRLIRSLLGRVPGHLPPETGSVRSVRGRVSFGAHMWEIDRPLVTTKTATVSLSRREPADDDDEAERIVDALRLPAEQPTAAEAETYLEWLLARRMCGPQLACDRWGRDQCEHWWEAQEHLAAPTLRHRLSCVRQWCQWCVVREFMASDPTAWLPRVRQPRAVPRALTEDQVRAIWSACATNRGRLAVALMLFEGLRRGEAARLDWADIDMARATMRVVGKGRQERLVPISEVTSGLLAGCGRQWGPVLRSETTGRRLTAGHVATLVRDTMAAAGVSATPHALRHTAASDALDAGCPIRTVQRFLGHATVQSTEVYLRRDVSDLRLAVDGRRYELGAASGRGQGEEGRR